jgi:hypothetical protein
LTLVARCALFIHEDDLQHKQRATMEWPVEETGMRIPLGCGARPCRHLFARSALPIALTFRLVTSLAHPAEPRRGPGDSQAAAAPAMPSSIELREGLMIAVGRPRNREPLAIDPITAQLVRGSWTMPKAGDVVALAPAPDRRWEKITAGADGNFSRPGLHGGYLATTVDSPDDAVRILDASGHSVVYVGGEPRVGDRYGHGYVRLPMRLHKGPNTLLFRGARDGLRARLTVPKAPAFFDAGDVTAPDLIDGQDIEAEAAIVVVNATEAWRDDLTIAAGFPGGGEMRTAVPALPPLSVRKAGFRFKGTPPRSGESCSLGLRLERAPRGTAPTECLDTAAIGLRVRRPGQAYKRTFRSDIDGSVQYFAVVPPLSEETVSGQDRPRPGLVLTLHGAAVEAIGQAEAYRPKPGLYLVAPTNRRPYGFDWEDWGRRDAIEVLELAHRLFATDPRRTYLTGHSMGGHGSWHLGVTFTDRFAAIAPSAGWISMWSYAGARRLDAQDPVQELMARVSTHRDTLLMSHNLASIGVYVLHGDADDNVPVDQARRMRQVLGEFHPDFAYHEQPGAGHWWGGECVDWPPLFAFLERRRIPPPAEVRRVDFITANPGISPRSHWATIEAQVRAMAPSTVHLRLDPGQHRCHGTTENVARLALDVGQARSDSKSDGSWTVELDGQTLADLAPVSSPGGLRLHLARIDGKWSATPPASPSRKGPHRMGPFKEAFGHRFILVVGTRGTPEENAWGLARARFDAETFWYNGNGSVDVVTDTMFLEPGRADQFRDRDVILYGHADANAAWPTLLGDSPVHVRRGQVRIGGRTFPGDGLTCLFCRPRPGNDRAFIGVVAGSGPAGLRLTEHLPYFLSGVDYPDCLLLDAGKANPGVSGAIAAGFFGDDWGVESGQFRFRD